MPLLQTIASRFNAQLGTVDAHEVYRSLLEGERVSLRGMLEASDVATSGAEGDFIDEIPPIMQEVMVRVLTANHEQQQLPITVAWRPGYDFGLEMYEAAGTNLSEGGITLIVQTPKPPIPAS